MTKSTKLNEKAKKERREENGKEKPVVEEKKEEKKTKAKPENKAKDTKKISGEGKKKEEEKLDKDKTEKAEKKQEKKTRAIVSGKNLPISTKHAAAICRFIKNKRTEEAILDLEKVIALKKPVPMKGEIPHRKGKGLASGRFPKKAARRILRLLKSASANAVNNGIENPVITEAVANIGSRPWGRFGQVRKKRTHIKIIVKNKTKK